MERAASLPVSGNKESDLAAFQTLLDDEAAAAAAQRVFERHGVDAANRHAVTVALRLDAQARYGSAFSKNGNCADVLQARTAVIYMEYLAGMNACLQGAGDPVGAGMAPSCYVLNEDLAGARYVEAYASYWLCVDGD